MDAHLVSIHSENEYQLIKALIRAHDYQKDHTYIGLSGCQKVSYEQNASWTVSRETSDCIVHD